MSQFDNDKTVADFDLEAFNREMEKKEKEKKSKATPPPKDDFADIDVDDKFDDLGGFDDIDDFDSFDNLDDLDDINDDLFDEAPSIKQKLSELDNTPPANNSSSQNNSSRRRRGGAPNLGNPDKTMIASVDSMQEEPSFEDDNISNNDGGDKTQIISLDQFENSLSENNQQQPESSIVVDLAKIKVIEGYNLEEYSIQKESVTVGRVENNDIMIPHGTISRNHCKFEKTVQGFQVSDLGSGNGIKVNGKKVNSKFIKTGDIVSLGQVKLQFIDLSVSLGSPIERPIHSTGGGLSPKNKKIIMISVISAVVLIAAIIGFVVKKQSDAKEAEALRLKKQKIEKRKKQIATFFNKGVSAYKNKEWNSAVDNFKLVLKLKPNFSEAKSYLKSSNEEKERFDLIKKSKDDLIKEDFKGALLKLSKIPETSGYYSEAQDNIKIANKKFKKYQLNLAQKNFDEENYETAKEIIVELLQSQPDFEEALKLQESIDEKLIDDKGDKGDKVASKKTMKFNPNKYKRKRRVSSSKYSKGLKMYANKQFSQAISYFNKISSKKAVEYAKYVGQVKNYYSKGDKYLKLKDTSKGIPAFNKALSLDGKLENKLSSDIKRKLSTLYGIRAKVRFGERKYSHAYKFTSRALRFNKSNKTANKVMSLLRKKAKDMYLNAYMKEARNPDAAKKIYKQILKMLPSSDPTAQKAKKRLK